MLKNTVLVRVLQDQQGGTRRSAQVVRHPSAAVMLLAKLTNCEHCCNQKADYNVAEARCVCFDNYHLLVLLRAPAITALLAQMQFPAMILCAAIFYNHTIKPDMTCWLVSMLHLHPAMLSHQDTLSR